MADIKYQDVHAYFSSRRNMTQFIKRCDHGLLTDLQNTLKVHISEWEVEQEKERKAIQHRDEKRRELLSLIISEGFTPEELITATAIKTKARRKIQQQYSKGDVI